MTRRKFLGLGLVALPAVAGCDARFAEPTWLRIVHFDLSPQPTLRLIQISDLH